MGSLKAIALTILGISAFIFVALFGRIPAFRKTPIGFLHRAIWIYIPNGLARLDDRLFGGCFVSCWNRTGQYVLYENHPLILIFFVALQVAGECIFVPSAWSRVSSFHHLCIVGATIPPYVLLYYCVTTKSFITRENHAVEMKRYPFDRILFHAGKSCRTCQFPKPARSKHCSICGACVSRLDHHCVWLMNCVGLHNYRYFLALLLSLSFLLTYGSYLGYCLLSDTLRELAPPQLQSAMHWHSLQGWSTWFNVWAVTIAADVRIGAVYLLMIMTAPLAIVFLGYHIYLIWAGTTTNESAKWSEWKEDVVEGYVYMSTLRKIFGQSALPAGWQRHDTWPAYSDQVLILTDGRPPPQGFMLSSASNEIVRPDRIDGDTLVDGRWDQLRSLKEVDNIYDIGFWNNLRDALDIPIRRKNI